MELMDWPGLRALIDAGDLPAVVRATGDLTEEQRRPLAGPLKEYSSWLRREGSNMNSAVRNWNDRITAAAVACAACLSTAAALAPELTWISLFRDLEDKSDPVAAASALLRARDVPWLPDLARRLADRLPAGDDDRAHRSANVWQLTDELVTATGIELPLTDGFVHCWAAHFMFRPDKDVAEAVRLDPRLVALVPRLFEVDGLGIRAIPLATLAEEGVLDRGVLIDGCLARLQRGGRAGHLENVTVLHGLLAPGLDEVADRTRDYVALLPAAHRMAAELGQRELRRLDNAGRLEFGTFREISESVLFRREHKLIKAQLDWLDAVAARDPRRAGDVLRAIALAFGQESAELQRRALTVARGHAGHADHATRAELAKAAVVLRPELRERAARAFGEPAVPPSAESAR